MSIQTLLNEKPYHNEPGFEKVFSLLNSSNLSLSYLLFFLLLKERNPGDVKAYNLIILHETLRVSVCENLENEHFEPKVIREAMMSSFLEYYPYYLETCAAYLKYDDTDMKVVLEIQNACFYIFIMLLIKCFLFSFTLL